MSVLRIVRGTAPLPRDLDDKFRRAFGREMNQDERRFFGLKFPKRKAQPSEQRDRTRKAA